MKHKIFLVAMFIATLLMVAPTDALAVKAKKRLPITTQITGDVLLVNSSGGSGNILSLQVKQNGTTLLSQNCPRPFSSSCSINISSLSSGTYTVVANCSNETLELAFTK